MTVRTAISLFVLTLVVSACGPSTTEEQSSAASSSASSMAAEAVELPDTMNVTYTGVVGALAAQPGSDATHQLNMDSGRTILLQSTDANLQLGSYLGKRVDVRGSLKVSGASVLLRVTEVTVLESTNDADEKVACGGIAGTQCPEQFTCADDPSDSCDPSSGGADCAGICTPTAQTSSVTSSQPAPASSAASSVLAVASSSAQRSVAATSSSRAPASSSSSSAASVAAIAPSEPVVAQMAKQQYRTPDIWTQKYCTGHVGFCVPVHKNWYYKSFGATTSTLWHVEFGMSEIDALGQGGISLNLISGSAEAVGGVDGQTEVKAGLIVGYKNWDGKHIQIAADARLSDAVTYMLDHLERYAPNE